MSSRRVDFMTPCTRARAVPTQARNTLRSSARLPVYCPLSSLRYDDLS